MYTGGTTGKPKGVIWRLGDLMHSMEGRSSGGSGGPAARHARRGGRVAAGRRAGGPDARHDARRPADARDRAVQLDGCHAGGGQVVTARRQARPAARLGDGGGPAGAHARGGGQRGVPAAGGRARRRRAGRAAARPQLAGFGRQLRHRAERPAQARAARARQRHDHRRARLQRGGPVRVRGHLVGRRPARPVLPCRGHPGPHPRRRRSCPAAARSASSRSAGRYPRAITRTPPRRRRRSPWSTGSATRCQATW